MAKNEPPLIKIIREAARVIWLLLLLLLLLLLVVVKKMVEKVGTHNPAKQLLKVHTY